MNKNNSTGMKLLSVLLGTLIGGFMWRCRGESGFGSSWGLYSVGLVLLLLIWQFYGDRKGMRYELIPVGALLTGLGVTGYATVIEQMSGTLWSDLPYGGSEPVYAPIDPYSGMVIILIMGFTLVPLFAFFVGTLFSGKNYKIVHYIIAIGIFFGVSYLMKATLAHPILKLINPEQVNYAALGLADSGFDYASPMRAYMAHFGNRRWTQEIPFFENYYMSIEHISDLFAVLAVSAYPLIAFRDKVTCIVSLVIDTFTAVSTTALSLLLDIGYDTGILGNVACPRALENGAGWGLWEFATGAAVGFITMLTLALLPGKYKETGAADMSPSFENEKLNYIFNLAATVFVFGVVPARVIGIRLDKLFRNIGLYEHDGTLGTVVIIVLSVLFGVFAILTLKKNILDKKTNAFGITPPAFASIAFSAYTLMCCLVYFFLNHGVLLFLPYREMTSPAKAWYILTGPENIATTVMLITYIIFVILYAVKRRADKRLSA